MVKAANDAGLVTVGDAKRGDIGISSSHYAHGLMASDTGCDWLTINGYLGEDGIRPFADVANE